MCRHPAQAVADVPAAMERIVAGALVSCSRTRSWPERMRAGLSSLLGELAADPRQAHALAHSFPRGDPASRAAYESALDRFLPYLSEGRDYAGLAAELPVRVELLALGAAEAIVVAAVEDGTAGELPELVPEVLFAVLVPFLGPDRAAREVRETSLALL